MKPSGAGLLFAGSFFFFNTNSVLLLVISLFRLSISSWYNLGSLYASRSVKMCPFLLGCSVCCHITVSSSHDFYLLSEPLSPQVAREINIDDSLFFFFFKLHSDIYCFSLEKHPFFKFHTAKQVKNFTRQINDNLNKNLLKKPHQEVCFKELEVNGQNDQTRSAVRIHRLDCDGN